MHRKGPGRGVHPGQNACMRRSKRGTLRGLPSSRCFMRCWLATSTHLAHYNSQVCKAGKHTPIKQEAPQGRLRGAAGAPPGACTAEFWPN